MTGGFAIGRTLTREPRVWRAAAIIVGGLWAIEFALLLVSLNLDSALSRSEVARHAVTATCGIVLSAALGYALLRWRRGPFWRLALIALAFGVAFSVGNTLSSLLIGGMPVANGAGFERARDASGNSLMQGFVFWFRIFLAGSGCLLAAAYALDARDGERRVAEAQALAHRAQVAALRYQINPHFLFNTLNAVSALVVSRDVERAEAMIANLSDFMRSSLTLDPLDDIPLEAEIAYERLYLDIEQVRFPDKLRVRMDLPDRLRHALVPSLILQPLVENAIKHGVARSTEPVEVRIGAVARGDVLRLTVADNARPRGAAPPPGAGVGVANVRKRLAARFGDAGRLVAGSTPGGGYMAEVRIPLRFAARHREAA